MDRTVMTGRMNMPLVLSAVLMKDTMETEALVESLIPEAREALARFRITGEDAEEEI